MTLDAGQDDLAPQMKRFKTDESERSTQRPGALDSLDSEPSPVVHVGNLSQRATDADLLQALGDQQFGAIAYSSCFHHKSMALVEFEDLQSARACIAFVTTNVVHVCGQPVQLNYSAIRSIRRHGLESKDPSNVLVLTIFNACYPINVDVIFQICNPHAPVKRIAIIRRKQLQALVEFESSEAARVVKHAINGADIYSGCCTLKVEFCSAAQVRVSRPSDDQRDYTNPDDGSAIALNNNNRKTLIGGGGAAVPEAPLARYGNNGKDATARSPGMSGYFGYNSVFSDAKDSVQPGRFSAYGYGSGSLPLYRGYDHRADQRSPAGELMSPISRSFAGESPSFRTGSGGGSTVLMIYGVNHRDFNCDKIFNLMCQYGNVFRVKFLLRKTDTCMVEMGDPSQVSSVLQNVNGLEVYGSRLTLRPSKQMEVSSTGQPFDLEDGSPSFRDYSHSRNQRFQDAEMASRNRRSEPSSALHWFNAPPNVDEEKMLKVFGECGAPMPLKISLNQQRSEKCRAGFAQFASVADATEALVLVNHTPISSTTSKYPYILKLAFYAARSGHSGD